ncbi:YbjN domain-containing protein [Streptomyces sp. NPDC048527]|uniref:YbjN domain-containing protein n=1 Tax=Streptomyces sp. NPDC048527 TaxID=3365568 RepID=UPI0037179930
MSIDPLTLPGSTQEQVPGPPPLLVPDQDLVSQLLDQLQVKYAVDDEGDLVTAWDGFRIYFLFRGDEQELFAIRSFYDRQHAPDQKSELLELLDEWNRDTLWPKVYTYTHEEDGMMRVLGESQMHIAMGVGVEHFATTTANWTQAAVAFDQWLTERLGGPEDTEDEADAEANAENTADDAEDTAEDDEE